VRSVPLCAFVPQERWLCTRLDAWIALGDVNSRLFQ